MKKLLHIIGSPRKASSRSEAIAAEFLKQYIMSNPDAVIDTLDLWDGSVPTYDGDKAAAKMTFFGDGTLEGPIKSAWDKVIEVAERFNSADEYLISVPMWNSNIPWVLKHYIDTITQPGLTFGFGADGYFPLFTGKKACVVFTSGVYSPGMPATFGLDFQVSYMKWWLNVIGIEMFSVNYLGNLVNPETVALGKEAMMQATAIAKDHFGPKMM
jgi:FMN-dependent NADH-azoreductase